MEISSQIIRKSRLLTGPWIFYDGTCPLCAGGAARFGPMLRRRGFRLATLQGDIARSLVTDALDEMKVVTRDGRIIGGAEAVAHIAGHVFWAQPLAGLWAIRPLRPPLQRLYAWIAARRHCTRGTCKWPATSGENS